MTAMVDHVRASWDEYFMSIAREVSKRATCDRKHVGAVVVRDKTILSTGYNGSVRGLPHCDEVGHMMEDGHCVRTIHAETNAIIQAAKNGTRIDDASIYVTASPCWPCFKLIANAGLKRIVFGEFYRDERIFEVAIRLGIKLDKVGGTDDGIGVRVPITPWSSTPAVHDGSYACVICGGEMHVDAIGGPHEKWTCLSCGAVFTPRTELRIVQEP